MMDWLDEMWQGRGSSRMVFNHYGMNWNRYSRYWMMNRSWSCVDDGRKGRGVNLRNMDGNSIVWHWSVM